MNSNEPFISGAIVIKRTFPLDAWINSFNSSTLGSHVQIYNTDEFYNLGDCMLWDYMNNLNY